MLAVVLSVLNISGRVVWTSGGIRRHTCASEAVNTREARLVRLALRVKQAIMALCQGVVALARLVRHLSTVYYWLLSRRRGVNGFDEDLVGEESRVCNVVLAVDGLDLVEWNLVSGAPAARGNLYLIIIWLLLILCLIVDQLDGPSRAIDWQRTLELGLRIIVDDVGVFSLSRAGSHLHPLDNAVGTLVPCMFCNALWTSCGQRCIAYQWIVFMRLIG